LSATKNKYFINDLNTSRQTLIKYTSNDHFGGRIVNLSGRLFLFGCMNNATTFEEYFAANSTWQVVKSDQLAANALMTAITVPASWFQWLPQMCFGLK
jgi:hypothetical protein